MTYNREKEKRKRLRREQAAFEAEAQRQTDNAELRAYLDANCEIASKIEDVLGCTSQQLRDFLEGLPR